MKTTCLTILTADRAWTEDNGKIGIAGIFDNFNLNKFPAQLFPFSVYIRLGYVKKGKNQIVLDFINEKDDNAILSIGAEFGVENDQDILQLHMPVPPIIIPSYGNYNFRLTCNNEVIGKHQIRIISNEVDKLQ